MRIHIDKIASVTRNLHLSRTLTVSRRIVAEAGAVVAGCIVGDKFVYNQLEDVHGRMSTLHHGDIIVGALGSRNALHGYEGVLPTAVECGQRLHLLNLGGVIGQCVSHNSDVGPPFELEVLGQVLVYPDFQSRRGRPANIAMPVLKDNGHLPSCPVIYVAGTCMNSGKTAAACALVRHLRRQGYRIGGLKLTGVSLMRDMLSMRDHGAEVVMDFTDAGVVCTGPETAARAAHALLSEMAAANPDAIIVETGDGILGEYGVQAILADPALAPRAAAFIFCANDPVGVAGGVRELKEHYGIRADVISGPATDNQVGVRFIEQETGLPAYNARTNPAKLGDYVRGLIHAEETRTANAG